MNTKNENKILNGSSANPVPAVEIVLDEVFGIEDSEPFDDIEEGDEGLVWRLYSASGEAYVRSSSFEECEQTRLSEIDLKLGVNPSSMWAVVYTTDCIQVDPLLVDVSSIGYRDQNLNAQIAIEFENQLIDWREDAKQYTGIFRLSYPADMLPLSLSGTDFERLLLEAFTPIFPNVSLHFEGGAERYEIESEKGFGSVVADFVECLVFDSFCKRNPQLKALKWLPVNRHCEKYCFVKLVAEYMGWV